MKKITLFLMAALLALNSMGQTDTLYVNLTSNDAQTYELNKVRNLTFSETELKVTTTNGTVNPFAYSNIESLTFVRKDYEEAPDCAMLTSPANAATDVAINAIVTWNMAANATSYDVYFGTATNPVFVTNTTATSYNPMLAEETTYYWKVVAKNAAGFALNCETRSFTTGSTTGPTINVQQIENERKDIEVFPNPVSDFLTVKSKTSISDIMVYDENGRIILHDMTHRQNAIVSFETCSSGIYFIQITTEREKLIRKIIKN
jgi:hypothetical protein